MLKILLIDDTLGRYADLIQRISNTYVTSSDLHTATNVKDALRKLEDHQFDLIVVDMMIPPTAWSKELITSGGITLLHHLTEDDSLNTPKYVVGITSASDVDPAVEKFFSNSTWSLIRHQANSTEWETRVLSLIKHAFEANTQEKQIGYGIDVCIVTALRDPEQSALLRWDNVWQPDAVFIDSQTSVRVGTITTESGRLLKIASACSQRMGSTEAALLTYKLIHHFRPRILAMAGICAGMEKKTDYGDAILANPVWDWTSSKWDIDEDGKARILPAPHYLTTERAIVERFALLQSNKRLLSSIKERWPGTPSHTELKIHLGPSASGPIVVADGKTFEDIKVNQNREVIGLEMEAYGVFCAAAALSEPRPKVFSLKSVCDFADPRKNDAMQRYASYSSAAILLAFLQQHVEFVLP